MQKAFADLITSPHVTQAYQSRALDIFLNIYDIHTLLTY